MSNRLVSIIANHNSKCYRIIKTLLRREKKIIISEANLLTFHLLNYRLVSTNKNESRENEDSSEKKTTYIIFENVIYDKRELISIFEKCYLILIISENEEDFYCNCINNKLNKDEYKREWNKYVHQIKNALNCIDETQLNYVILDCSNKTEAHIRKFYDFIFLKSTPLEDREKYFISKENAYKRIETIQLERNIDTVMSTRRACRNTFSDQLDSALEPYLDKFEETRNETELVDYILYKYNYSYSIYSYEERTVYLRMISADRNAFGRNPCIRSILIQSAISLSEMISIGPNDSEKIYRFDDIIELLWTIGTRFDKILFNDSQYINLIIKMLQNKDNNIKFKATQLIGQMLENNFQRYLHKFADYNKTTDTNSVQLVYDAIKEYFKQMIEDQNETKIIENFFDRPNCSSLKYLLRGSTNNCKYISKPQIEELIDYASKFIKRRYFQLADIVYGTLNMILKYGDTQMWSNINICDLLSEVNSLITGPFHLKTKYAIGFYVDLFNFRRMRTIKTTFSNEDDKSENINEYIIENDDIKVVHMNSAVYSSMTERIHTIKQKLRQDKINKPLIFSENMRNIVANVTNYNEIEIENEELKKKIKELNEKIEELKQEIFCLNKELSVKNDLIKSVDERKRLVGNKSLSKPENSKTIVRENVDIEKLKLQECSPLGVKKFIETIAESRQNLKEFRKALCGVMTHLGASLYSSPVHFLYEIIQNTEDANFENTNKKRFLKMIIDTEYICFCSNEDGFTDENVKSICSISESNKIKGKHIGNKGLGFKSVYSCTDNPIVISKPYWQFMFSKTPDNDEIAYITPIYIEGEDLPSDLNELIETNENCNTFIYLPLKDKLKYSNNQQFYNLLLKHIDSKILIFTKKLENLIVEDKIKGINRNILCNKTEIDHEDKSVYCAEVSIQEEASKWTKWRLYSTKLFIDDAYVDEENLSLHETEICLVFPNPMNNTNETHYPIYCCLPIQETDFNFIINAYWCLITNRDCINEASAYNMFLRDEIAKFYTKCILNDVYFQKEGIFKCLPRKSGLLSSWWNMFFDIIKIDMKPKVKELIGDNKMFKKRLENKMLLDLVPIDVLNSLSIEIVSPEKLNLTAYDLENFGIKQLTITDLFECFRNDKLSNQLRNWFDNYDSQWWSNFFKILCDTCENIIDISKSCDIFLHRRHLKNTEIQCKRRKLFQKIKYFVCYKKDLYMWRDDIEILDYNSEYERRYLTEVLMVQEITLKDMIDYLIGWHTQLNQEKETKTCVWYDLDFIKSNSNDVGFSKGIKDSLLFDVVSIPVNSNSNISFVPIKYSFIPSLFSIDGLPLILDNTVYQIDFNSLTIFLKEQEKYNINEIISWEYFLLKNGCLQPHFDIERVKLLHEKKELPLMKQFTEYSKNNISILEALVESLNINSIYVIQHLPIAATYLNTVKHIPVANTCLKSLFDNYLPSVEVPKYAIELAKRLGVTTELDFRCCIKVLNSCCNENIKDENVYKEWITKLQLYINHVEPSELENVKNIKIICLNDIENNQKYFSISEIYCCDETVVVREICKQLDKTLINFDHNKTYKSIEASLIRIGCLTKPNFDDLLTVFKNLACDDSVFAIESITCMLSTDGYELFKELYKSFEALLKLINKDGSETDELYRSEMFLKNFQLISYNRRLHSFNDQKIIICNKAVFIDAFIDSIPANSLFFDPDLAKQCPLTMKFLKAIDFSDITVTYLKHENNNIEHTNNELNKIIREISKVDNFEVLIVDRLDIRVAYLEGFYEPLRIENIENKKLQIMDFIFKQSYAIFNKKLLVCYYSRLRNSDGLLIRALKDFLKLIYPEKNIDSFSKVTQLIKDIRLWRPSDQASRDPTPFNTSDVIFADNIINCIEAHDFLPTKGQRKKHFTHISYENDEMCFTERVKQITSEVNKIEVNSNNRRSEQDQKPKTQDYIEMKRIGDRAEHFFCCYLKHHYSENFNEYTDWVSSARSKVYKSGSQTDDTLGYDFVVTDNKGLFCSNKSKNDINVKKCYIEVKGRKHEWDGTFHLSRNEFDKRNQLSSDTEAYIIVVIENVCCESKMNIASIINWTDDERIITLYADSYTARTFNRTSVLESQNNRQVIESPCHVNKGNTDTLDISGLNETISDNDLKEVFERFGTIVSCKKKLGWDVALIKFSSKEEATQAYIKLTSEKLILKGAPIKINFYKPNESNSSFRQSVSYSNSNNNKLKKLSKSPETWRRNDSNVLSTDKQASKFELNKNK